MKKMKKNFIILFLIALIPIKAFALIEVDITRGNLNPLPLAVSLYLLMINPKKVLKRYLKKKILVLKFLLLLKII